MTMLAAAAFCAAASMHFHTPMLGKIASDFGVGAAAAGWIATMTFGGYLIGMIFIVPLGDRLDKRRLILGQMVGLLASTLAMGLSPTLPAAVVASLVLGVCSCISQIVVPVVVELAPTSGRGRMVGTLLSALFLGILFGRLTGGFIAEHLGWRWSFAMSAAMIAVLLPALWRHLPSMPARVSMPYLALMRSVIDLIRTRPELRRTSTIQLLLGVCYGGFWATIAPALALLHRLGPAQAGMMGIPGASGILISRLAGRWMDRRGVFPVVTTAVCLVLGASVLMQFAGWSVWIMAAGAALLDCGLRGSLVANQTQISTFAPEARSRINTVFGAYMWGGNSVGALLASTALAHFGWNATCSVFAACCIAALALQLANRPA